MSKHKQPPKKPCPKCGHMYRVTSTCKGCGHYLAGDSDKSGCLDKLLIGLSILAAFTFLFSFIFDLVV